VIRTKIKLKVQGTGQIRLNLITDPKSAKQVLVRVGGRANRKTPYSTKQRAALKRCAMTNTLANGAKPFGDQALAPFTGHCL
jgi:hypothetical protein